MLVFPLKIKGGNSQKESKDDDSDVEGSFTLLPVEGIKQLSPTDSDVHDGRARKRIHLSK